MEESTTRQYAYIVPQYTYHTKTRQHSMSIAVEGVDTIFWQEILKVFRTLTKIYVRDNRLYIYFVPLD